MKMAGTEADLWSDNSDMCNFHLSSILMTPTLGSQSQLGPEDTVDKG